MSTKLSLPINSNSILSTLKRWAATLSTKAFITLLDFEPIRYQPSYSCSGSMTFTSVTTQLAWYIQLGPLVIFTVDAWGTVGGTVDTEVHISLPLRSMSVYGCMIGNVSIDGGLGRPAGVLFVNNETIKIRRYDNASWVAGASRAARVTGLYLTSQV